MLLRIRNLYQKIRRILAEEEILPVREAILSGRKPHYLDEVGADGAVYLFPDCAPPKLLEDGSRGQRREGHWCVYQLGNIYCAREISPNRWQWVVDDAAEIAASNLFVAKRDLWKALTTRVLSSDELAAVLSEGVEAIPYYGGSYDLAERLAEYHGALRVQMTLRKLVVV